MLTFKALHGQARAYVVDMPTPYRPQRNLRSAGQLQLVVSRTTTKQGDRAFSVAPTILWDSLPLVLRHAVTLTRVLSSSSSVMPAGVGDSVPAFHRLL